MVLVFVETVNGLIKKAGQEALTYGRKLAEQTGLSCKALVLGPSSDPGSCGIYGASSVLHLADTAFAQFDSQTYSTAIAEVALKEGATIVVLSHTANGKSLVGRIAVRLKAGSVSGVGELPSNLSPFTVRKGAFSGKAFADYQILTPISVLSVMGNALQPEANGGNAPVESIDLPVMSSRYKVIKVDKVEGIVPLPEATVVVSGGRGLKGPENWGLIEDLAEVLSATTACSRPVADSGWRPHHEHVGQTGIAIRPNLYIAIGISGAIQHLAGVNRSKVIVVINKDPEAPFFKAADYGVVGDLFEVVPRLTAAIKKSLAG
ncbi:MAG: electron transfer flavoprotein subunit alpha/FixB family protein [Saprospiraceae bacterium]|nr:electron transfer flavoprotein subunit alpha/FixB family protein [Saprospiraceae bacterium]